MDWIRMLIGCALTLAATPQGAECVYRGKLLGELRTLAHRVSGRVYVASEDSLYLVDFHYDGGGPDAFFWLSRDHEPDDGGTIVPDENGSWSPLGRYDNRTILITLPEGKKITDYGSFAVWCRKFSANFGDVRIPSDFDLPAEQTIGTFVNGAHGIRSGPVTLLDSQTVHIARFYYDGAGPDAYFMVGNSSEITHVGATKVPDEEGSTERLGRYEGKDLFLSLPGSVDWGDARWLSVYCVRAVTSLASIEIPAALSIPVKLGARPTQALPPSHGPRLPNAMRVTSASADQYFGKKIGQLGTTTHGVSGTVYAAKDNALVIQDFSYDGSGPDAFFMVGETDPPSDQGTVLSNEVGSKAKLPSYSKKTLVVILPTGKIVTDYKWFSVYCRQAKQSFGHVDIPSDLDYPKELVLGTSLKGAHNTRAASIVLKDVKTVFLSQFGYDGSAPDAYILTGKGKPNGGGTKIPDETGSLSRLKGYNNVDLTLTLPGGLTAFDVDWISVYCIRFSENFFSVNVPANPNVPPYLASLMMENQKFDSCESIFPDKLQVSWRMDGTQVFIRLRGRVAQGEYVAFGISGNKDKTQMIGGDPAIAYYNEAQGKVLLQDFYLDAKSQCSTNGGVCPDAQHGGKDDLMLWSSSFSNGMLEVIYSRPLAAGDNFDKNIPGSGEVAIIAAFGPQNKDKTVLFHTKYYLRDTVKIAFGRPPLYNCMPFGENSGISEDDKKAFAARKIKGITHFTAQIGPTGGSRGYEKITGSSGWGISWWINGQLIPVLYVERGTTYTFVPQGGHDPSNSARYHPFYITDNPKGGGSKEDVSTLGKPGHLLLAGAVMGKDGRPNVTQAIGRYCEWEQKTVDRSNEVATFDEYKNTLHLQCESGYPDNQFTWTPGKDTPNTVYYQCFTHYYLGWKIKVKNPGEPDDDDDEHKNRHGGLMAGSASLVAAALFLPLILAKV